MLDEHRDNFCTQIRIWSLSHAAGASEAGAGQQHAGAGQQQAGTGQGGQGSTSGASQSEARRRAGSLFTRVQQAAQVIRQEVSLDEQKQAAVTAPRVTQPASMGCMLTPIEHRAHAMSRF